MHDINFSDDVLDRTSRNQRNMLTAHRSLVDAYRNTVPSVTNRQLSDVVRFGYMIEDEAQHHRINWIISYEFDDDAYKFTLLTLRKILVLYDAGDLYGLGNIYTDILDTLRELCNSNAHLGWTLFTYIRWYIGALADVVNTVLMATYNKEKS